MKANEPGERKTVGAILAEARSRRGESIDDIQKKTRIRGKYLNALERDDYAAVPGDVYAKGFIKTYAMHLGLDPEPLIKQYITEYDHPIKFESKMNVEPIAAKAGGWSKRFTMTLVVIGCVFALLYWGASTSKKTMDEELKSRSGVNSKTPTSQLNSPPLSQEPTTKQPGLNLTVTATADEGCWLSVAADGQQVFEGLVQKGQTQQLTAEQAMTLDIGNAGGVQIKRDGKDVGPLGEKGAVIQKVFTAEGK